jgi:hypothetical protein
LGPCSVGRVGKWKGRGRTKSGPRSV